MRENSMLELKKVVYLVIYMANLCFDINSIKYGKIHKESFPTQSKILTPQHCQRVFWKISRKYHVLIQISNHQSCYYSTVKIHILYGAQNSVKITSSTLFWKYMKTKHFITPEPKNKFANWFLTVLTMLFDNKTIS